MKQSVFFQIFAADIQNVIPVDQVALRIHSDQPVRIAVKRQPQIEDPAFHQLLQRFRMRRAAFCIDIDAIGFAVNDRAVRAHPAQQLFRGCRRRTVGQIQCQMKLFKPEIKQRFQPVQIMFQTFVIPDDLSNLLAADQRNFRQPVDIVFHQRFNLGGQLNPRLGENFDPVVIVRIVAGRDHHAAAELFALDQIRHARRRAIA